MTFGFRVTQETLDGMVTGQEGLDMQELLDGVANNLREDPGDTRAAWWIDTDIYNPSFGRHRLWTCSAKLRQSEAKAKGSTQWQDLRH